MPCPYFHPLHVAEHPTHSSARLPLIDEYDGVCEANSPAVPVPTESRFRCNLGYCADICNRFPAAETLSALRYHVVRCTAASLELLCIAEADHHPVRWSTLNYCIAEGGFQPSEAAFSGETLSQALAFCRSYLSRFPAPVPCK